MGSPASRILIDARLHPATAGGVAIHAASLLRGLALTGAGGIGVFVSPENSDWILQSCDPTWEVIEERKPNFSRLGRRKLAETLRKSSIGIHALRILRDRGPLELSIPEEPIEITKFNPRIVHFPAQRAFRTSRPFVYQPHDLQHEHLPGNFDAETLAWRRLVYPEMMSKASFVVVGTTWTRNDVIRGHPELEHRRVRVIPVPPPFDTPSVEWQPAGAHPWQILYPAAPWPHKNHGRLLEAVRLLVDSGKPINLVLPGPSFRGNEPLLSAVRSLGVENFVSLPGFLTESELHSLYVSSSMLVMPSLFESESIPIWEAFRHGLPVAASNVTAIPDQCGSAAVLFDPTSPSAIADAMSLLGQPSEYSLRLGRLGLERVKAFSLEDSAQSFLELYHYAGRDRIPPESTENFFARGI